MAAIYHISNQWVYLMEASKFEAIYYLSPTQEGMYFLNELSPDSTEYFIQYCISIEGAFSSNFAKQSLALLALKHSILRANFVMPKSSDRVFQVILKNKEIEYISLDISKSDNIDTELENIKSADIKRGFDLKKGSLIRITEVRCSEEKVILIWSIHHIIVDGWSISILLTDFMDYYGRITNGEKYEAIEKAIYDSTSSRASHEQYVKWLEKKDIDHGLKYWAELLRDYNGGSNIKPISRNDNKGDISVANNKLSIKGKAFEKIIKAAKKCKVTVNTVVEAALGYVIGRYCYSDDIVLGKVTSGRNVDIPSIEQTVGLFINTLPSRLYYPENTTWAELLNEIQNREIENEKYSYCPLVRIQKASGHGNLFSVLYTYENYYVDDDAMEKMFSSFVKNMKVSLDGIREKTNYPLSFSVYEGDSLELEVKYNPNEYSNRETELILRRWIYVLEQISSDVEMDVHNTSVFLRDYDLSECIDTKFTKYLGKDTVPDLFLNAVARRKDEVALCCGKESLSYEEFGDRAKKLAYTLQKAGIKPNDFVVIIMERCIELMISIYAVMLSGAAFVPIDPKYPNERIKMTIEDCEPKVVLTNGVYDVQFCSIMDVSKIDWNSLNSDGWQRVHGLNDAVYMIYTSGTTGIPKGVVVEHHTLMNYLNHLLTNCCNGIRSEVVAPLFTSVGVDLTMTTFILPVVTGGKIIIYNQLPAEDIDNAFRNDEITFVKMTPSHMRMANALYDSHKLPNLKTIVIGGEILDGITCQEFLDKYGSHVKIHNSYGPTETTVGCSYYIYDSKDGYTHALPIGRPLLNTCIIIMNGMQPCGVGMTGELCIVGAGVSRGYLHRPELNQEKFINNPFGEGRMYRSGDLARWIPDGKIECFGRLDNQIKLRGHRIELAEIESIIKERTTVDDVCVLVVGEHSKQEICAFYTASKELSGEEIKAVLHQWVPEYMIPYYTLQVENIPVTTGGKVDKRALLALDYSKSYKYEAPKNDIEKKLAAIYKKVLGTDLIGRSDSFFERGGHSIKAVQAINAINSELDVNVPLTAFFASPKVCDLAEYISSLDSVNNVKTIPYAKEKKKYAMSPSQKRIFIISQIDDIGIAYNMPVAFKVNDINVERLEKAFSALIDRHESLHTKFEFSDNNFYQIIEPNVSAKIQLEEVQFLNDEVIKTSISDFVKPFDLSVAPLMRIKAVVAKSGKSMIILDIHHIVADGISIRIIFDELLSLYKGCELNETRQYKDYSEWLSMRDFSNQREYWTNEFADGIPVLELQLDYTRPQMQQFDGADLTIKLDSSVREKIIAASRKFNVTESMLFMTALLILLERESLQNDIVIGMPVAARMHKDTEHMVGVFINTLAIKFNIKETDKIKDLLERVNKKCIHAYENQEYPIELLLDDLKVIRDVSRNPLYDVLFNFKEFDDKGLYSGTDVEMVDMNETTAKLDLSFDINCSLDGYSLILQYSTALFKESTIKLMLNHYVQLIKNIADSSDGLVADISSIDAEEKELLCSEFNRTETEYARESTVAECFKVSAHNNSDKYAVIFHDRAITYLELDNMSDILANRLIDSGVKRGDFIAIISARSEKVIIAMLAVLKVGAAYIPINADLAEERINYILNDSGCKLALTYGYGNSLDVEYIIRLDEEKLNYQAAKIPEIKGAPSDVCYAIYTSGSTGNPKGVMIKNNNVVNYCTKNKFNLMGGAIKSDCKKIVSVTSIAFDIFVTESLLPLINGMTIVMADEEEQIFAKSFNSLVMKNNVDILQTTPSKMKLYMTDKENRDFLSRLKVIALGGEKFDIFLYKELQENTSAQIVNVYGPTETTVWSTWYIAKGDEYELPIGQPLANTQVYILNGEKLTGINVKGELCIAGDGVSKGYINLPKLTSERFIKNPFGEGLLYRTGDIARWNAEGQIEFFGRNDEQIKLFGHRIELGEIENALKALDPVTNAAVVVRKYNGGDCLCAFVVYSQVIDSTDIKAELKKVLPVYMIPSVIIPMDSLPLNNNGKLDKKNLPEIPESHYITIDEDNGIDTPIKKIIYKVLCKELGINDISGSTDLFSLGANSITMIMISTRLRNDYGLKISFNDMFQYPSISGMAAHIAYEKNADVDYVEIINNEMEMHDIKGKADTMTGYGEEIIIALYDASNVSNTAIENLKKKFDKNINYWIASDQFDDDQYLSAKELSEKYLDVYDENTVSAMTEMILSYNKEYFKSFASGEIVSEFRLSGAQKIRISNPQSVRGFIPVEIGYEEVTNNIRKLLSEQELMNCSIFNNIDGSYKWRCYNKHREYNLKYINLDGYTPDAACDIISKLTENVSDVVKDISEDMIPYTFVFVHINNSFNGVLAIINHIICDGFSFEYIKSCIRSDNKQEDHMPEMYSEYVSLCRQKPSVSQTTIIKKFKISEYFSAIKNASKRIESIGEKGNTSVGVEVPIREISDPVDIAFNRFTRIVTDYLKIMNIPVMVINHSKKAGKIDFSRTVGEFIDYIPVYFNGKDNYESFSAQIEENIQFAQENNLHFADLIEFTQNIPVIGRMTDDFFEKTFFVFNFRGIENRKSFFHFQSKNGKLSHAIEFDAVISDNILRMKIDLPIKCDSEKITAYLEGRESK